MAEIKNFPNNVDEYIGAENVMKWLHGRTSGVFAAGNNLAVTSQGGMNLAVSDGVGWIANSESDGTVFWNDAFKTTGTQLALTLELADAFNPRIDRIVVSWETVDYTVKPEIKVLKGTPAGTPAAPALTRTASKWEISLAQIYVGAAVSGVTAANITDERLNSAVCGLVTAALEIDSTMANNQFIQMLADVQSDSQELLSLIKTELDNLNAGTEVMLKTVYDPDNDGVIDGILQAQEAAEAAQSTAAAAQTAATAAATAAANAQSTANSASTAASAAQSTANNALPKSGGTVSGNLNITGNLTLKGSGNYGNKINLGDGDYVHISEPEDDILELKGKYIRFVTTDTSNSPLPLNQGGTGVTSMEALKTAMGFKKITASTTDLTAGTSSLATGELYLVYE